MSTLIERCKFCKANVSYEESQRYIRCRSCGNTLVVAAFESQQAKYEQAVADSAQAKQDLAQAEQEKKEAQDRLNEALSSLDELAGTGRGNTALLNRLIEQGDSSRDALTSLLTQIRGDQKSGQDAITSLLVAVAGSQKDDSAKITALEETARNILAHHNNTDELIRSVSGQLSMDAARTNTLLSELTQWSRENHSKDLERLRQIQASGSALLSGQQEIDRKIHDLAETAGKTAAAIRAFEGKWEQARLNELVELYHQAELFQQEREFDKAEHYYRQVLIHGGKDPEVYWQLLLCHYCVEYQTDDEGNRIPSILYPDLSDPSEVAVRKELFANLQTNEDRNYYSSELAVIENILDKYRRVKDRMSYDVFISVKQSDHGHYTTDSDIASELYDTIRNMGLRVFNSRREISSLPPGEEYEPYIMAALLSSKVMIVVGTRPEYMDSQWVRNEWSRFQWLRKNEQQISGRSERTLLCCLSYDMDPYSIPKALNPSRQALRYGPAVTDILKNVLAPYIAPSPAATPARPASGGPSAAAIQMMAWLYTGNFDAVTNKYNDLLQRGESLDQVSIHLYSLCAKYRLTNPDQLAAADVNLAAEPAFLIARNVAVSPSDQSLLADLLNRNEASRKNRVQPTPVDPEAERKAMEEKLRAVREEIRRKQQEEDKRNAHDEAKKKKWEKDVQIDGGVKMRAIMEEIRREQKEEDERKAREEAERKQKEEAERLEREEKLKAAREELRRKQQEEDARKAREEAEKKQKAEAERLEREAKLKAAREEIRRKQQEEAERAAREEALKKEQEEFARKQREWEERQRQQEEQLRREREQLQKDKQSAASTTSAPQRKAYSVQDKINFWSQNLPTVYNSCRVGSAVDARLAAAAMQRLGAPASPNDPAIALIEVKKGFRQGIVTVVITPSRIMVDAGEPKIYPPLILDMNNIRATTAVPMNTSPKKNHFVVALKSGNQRSIAETQKPMTDTINFKALSNAVNAYIKQFEA